jgi:cytochrome c551/c552
MIRRALLVVVCAVALAACGDTGPPVTGAAADGEALFTRTVLGSNAGCITCHSLKPDVVLVGPSLATIGRDAGSRQPGVAAADYLRSSIIDPDAYVLEGFDAGRMPQDWEEQLSVAEIDGLVEYLLTRGAGQ